MSHHRMHPYNTSFNQQKQDEAPAPEDDLPAVENIDEDLPANEPQPNVEETAKQESVEAAEQDCKKEMEDMRLRMAAEMDNFKKRLRRDHEEQMRYASEKVLGDLLPALDNLDLALQYASQHEACQDMMQGIEMTRKQLLEALGKHGLVLVGERGEEFNPAIHEAIGMDADPELEKGKVSKVMQKGYKLNERLLRPAKVMVNN